MKKQVSFDDVIGKKFVSQHWDNDKMILVFEDDSFVYVTAKPSWGDGAEIETGEKITEFGLLDEPHIFLQADVITIEELDEKRKQRKEREEARAKVHRRQTYEALKREFEDTTE